MEKTISLRLEQSTLDKLDDYADSFGINRSKTLRHIIESYDSKKRYAMFRWDDTCNTYFDLAEVPFLDYAFEISRSMPNQLFMVVMFDLLRRPTNYFQIKDGKEVETQHSLYW